MGVVESRCRVHATCIKRLRRMSIRHTIVLLASLAASGVSPAAGEEACAIAAACLEKCIAEPGGEACASPCPGPPLRPRATGAASRPANLKVAYFLHH